MIKSINIEEASGKIQCLFMIKILREIRTAGNFFNLIKKKKTPMETYKQQEV